MLGGVCGKIRKNNNLEMYLRYNIWVVSMEEIVKRCCLRWFGMYVEDEG